MLKRLMVLSFTFLAVGIAGASPFHEAELIFPLQGKHVHSSCAVECPNGDLLACWFYGTGERTARDVEIRGARKRKGDGSWSPVFLMADTPNFPDCNPVMFIDPKNRLRLAWIAVLAEGWQHSLLRYRTSEDYMGEGPPVWSWQDLILLKPGEEFATTIRGKFDELDYEEGWAEYALPYTRLISEAAQDPIKRQTGWMPRIRPIYLKDGRLLFPLYSDGFNVGLLAISDDGGDTWRASRPIVGMGPIQPTLVEKKDGTIVAYMRDSGDPPGRVLISESEDRGESWSLATDTDIPNPGSSLSVISLRSGDWVMAHNDAESGRRSLAIRLSNDEGESWKWVRHIERSEDGWYAYPNMFEGSDGKIHITYSYREAETGRSIKHAAFNADWIKEGDLQRLP